MIRPGVVITVLDHSSGAPVEGATGRVWSESDTIILYAQRDAELAAVAPAGTYRVEVAKEGYATWTARDVRVRADQCGTRSTHLLAWMYPS